MTNTFYSILSFIVTLSILIFVHELGHYLAARAFGVGVKRFSIGFGPKLWSRRDKRGTLWQVAGVPLGGFVEMSGEFGRLKLPEDSAPPDAAERASLLKRSVIAFAGPAANLLFAVLCTWVIFVGLGTPQAGRIEISGFGSVMQGSAAEQAGLMEGDIPLKVDGAPITNFNDFVQAIGKSEGQIMSITVQRKTEQLVFETAARKNSDGRWLLGVTAPPTSFTPVGVLDASVKSVVYTWDIIVRIFNALLNIIVDRDTEQLGGPLRIAQIAAEAAQTGFFGFINFLALFSINLAIFNLLPIPALDGGYLAFFSMVPIFGRKIADKIARVTIPIGIGALILFMVFVIANDFWRI